MFSDVRKEVGEGDFRQTSLHPLLCFAECDLKRGLNMTAYRALLGFLILMNGKRLGGIHGEIDIEEGNLGWLFRQFAKSVFAFGRYDQPCFRELCQSPPHEAGARVHASRKIRGRHLGAGLIAETGHQVSCNRELIVRGHECDF